MRLKLEMHRTSAVATLFLALVFLLAPSGVSAATTIFCTVNTGCNGGGANTFSVPSDWNNSNNQVACIGAGGDAGDAVGGGGGAYASTTNVSLTPGGTASYVIAFGGTELDAYFNGAASSSASVSCAPGHNVFGPYAGLGGKTTNSTGITKFAGGDGFQGGGGAAGMNGAGKNGGSSTEAKGGGGGGGSNGGSSSAGADATTVNGANGGNGTGGTGGGAGSSINGSPGGTGTVGGGGGGGKSETTLGTAGGNGGSDTSFDGSHGAGGGGGSGGGCTSGNAGGFTGDGGAGAAYGGGGGSAGLAAIGLDPCTVNSGGGPGADSIIVVIYTPTTPGSRVIRLYGNVRLRGVRLY